jgi:hypothetical protein
MAYSWLRQALWPHQKNISKRIMHNWREKACLKRIGWSLKKVEIEGWEGVVEKRGGVDETSCLWKSW